MPSLWVQCHLNLSKLSWKYWWQLDASSVQNSTDIYMLQTKQLEYWNLCQLKAAVRLEKVGMKHSSGRSARKAACIKLGIKQNCTHDQVIKKLQEAINAML